eukprot:2299622-Pyramimonas_sp.AAC.2
MLVEDAKQLKGRLAYVVVDDVHSNKFHVPLAIAHNYAGKPSSSAVTGEPSSPAVKGLSAPPDIILDNTIFPDCSGVAAGAGGATAPPYSRRPRRYRGHVPPGPHLLRAPRRRLPPGINNNKALKP